MQPSVRQYVRYEHRDVISYGILDGAEIRQVRGDLFGSATETGMKIELKKVRLLYPCEPSKILAVGLNWMKVSKKHASAK